MLEHLGIDPVAETVYRVMLQQPDSGTSAIASQLGWEHDEVDRALDRLARLDLIRVDQHDRRQPYPVRPGVGVSALLSRAEAELARRQRQLESIRPAVNALVAEFGTTCEAPVETIDHLSSVEAIRRQL